MAFGWYSFHRGDAASIETDGLPTVISDASKVKGRPRLKLARLLRTQCMSRISLFARIEVGSVLVHHITSPKRCLPRTRFGGAYNILLYIDIGVDVES